MSRLYLGAPPNCTDAAVKIDGKFRTTDNPCGVYCSKYDWEQWRRFARTRVVEVMERSSLRPELMNQAKAILAEIEATTNPSMIDLGSSTTRLATLYRYADCLSTIPPDTDPPIIPKKEETTDKIKDWIVTAGVIGAALLGLYMYQKRARR